MKRIMLVCSAGMSTSLLVTKMEKVAEGATEKYDIFAVAESEAKNHYDSVHVILLGPQVRYLLKKIEEEISGKDIPVAIINTVDYGMMNGKKVFDTAVELIG